MEIILSSQSSQKNHYHSSKECPKKENLTYHIPNTKINLNFPPPFLPLKDAVQSETHDIFHSNTHYLLFSALDTQKTNDLTAKAKSTRC